MASDIEALALRIKALEGLIKSRNGTQLADSSVDTGDDSAPIADAIQAAVDVTTAIPGLQELLDTNEQRLQDNADAVAAAMDAADAAEAAGLQAGQDASDAADAALEKAQEALDAAAAAGGGATYTGRAPTSSDPGVDGQQWFVWDSNYKITAYYVYDASTSQWVQTEITDAVLGNLDAGSITSGYLGAERIAAASLTAAVLAADTLTSREIGADAILARHIKAAEITGAKIAAATITGGNIAANTITAGNIAAGTITANEIAAGTITATQINLDTLNGKTITGATYKSAASGTRIEISGTTLSVYSSKQTAPVGGIQATDDDQFSAISIINKYFTSNQSGIAVTVPRNPSALTYESTRRLNLTTSHGISAPVAMIDTLVTTGSARAPYPIIDGVNTDGTLAVRVTADQFRFGTQAGRPVIFSQGNASANPTVIVQANDIQDANGLSLVTRDGIIVTPNADVAVSGTTEVTGQFSNKQVSGTVPLTAWSQTSGFTVPAGMGGLWLCTLTCRLLTGGQVFFGLNGTGAAQRVAFQDGSNATLTVPLRLAAGDVLRLMMYSSAASTSIATATRFSAFRISS